MEENTLPVEEIVPPAGGEQPQPEVPPQEEKTGLGLEEVLMALDAVSNADKTLAQAETKIVHQKRKLRNIEDGVQPEENEAKIEEIVARKLDELGVKAKSDEDDPELKAIQVQRAELKTREAKLLELAESLKSKQTMSRSAGGSNQDRLRPVEDLSSNLNADQKALYQKIADERGMSLDFVLKAKAEADTKGESLIFYLKKKKN